MAYQFVKNKLYKDLTNLVCSCMGIDPEQTRARKTIINCHVKYLGAFRRKIDPDFGELLLKPTDCAETSFLLKFVNQRSY